MSELLEFLRTHDEAFPSLYSDFRFQRNTNPDGYQANSSAWLRALTSAVKAGLIPSQTSGSNSPFILESSPELLRELQTQEYGQPLALGAVLEDAVKSKALLPLKEFLENKQSLYHKSWIPTPWQLLAWALRQAGLGGGGAQDRLVRSQFVVVANVENAAKVLLQRAGKISASEADRIYSKDLFAKTFSTTLGVESINPLDLDVLLMHLSRDLGALAFEKESGVVKFKTAAEPQPQPITSEDRSIASLRTLISDLQPQIESLTSRIAELDIAAREAVSEKQTIKAKTSLRQKKMANTKLQQRSDMLAQLEGVYASIEQASDQVQIVKVLEDSGKTLKSLNAQTGGADKVSEVMDDLRESMMDTEQIGNAINEVSAGEIDEGEVEDELEALENVEREKIEAKEREEREKREAKEREEKEKLEAEEAEKTRLRLAELESAPKEAGEKTGEKTDEEEVAGKVAQDSAA
ncbi:uncharacterized protein MYCFIDRAFT_205205 [Pseudocercospora fijiensis CIRAD86]|uniref:SNF7 family protein n=1 Tax=Pseudocercospora fijiensis (strain CIRAD86) TaxID=383855 RepID=M3AN80_PSEFD|nr:uncharacterized protein MYCFIDRAFT_205205 [Pseudocercospora fijiensis CIRAD86]EME78922.1 hypothetical protein MYCFIDRAFT_205205 [Pseudocercospora fijiensis CIRAD86]